MIENQINQTLITDNDVTEMARSMGLEVNIGPTTDDGATSTSNLSSVSGTEDPFRHARERQESPAITELTSEHLLAGTGMLASTQLENEEVPFENTAIEIEESEAVEDETLDPNSAATPTDELLEATVEPNIIPPISESVNTAESTIRFSGASWFEAAKDISVTMAGVGGIGSWTSLLLSRISTSIRINLYDDDKVEVVNLAGQLFSNNQVGLYKVYAAQEVIRYFSGSYCQALSNRITSSSIIYDKIVICGFDNMAARKLLYSKWKALAKNVPVAEQGSFLFIDGRMNAEEFQIFSITGDDEYNMKKYEEEFLFSDAEVAPAVCSYKQTTYCASMIASFIVNSLVNFLSNQNLENMPRQVPFYINYDAQLMHLKLES